SCSSSAHRTSARNSLNVCPRCNACAKAPRLKKRGGHSAAQPDRGPDQQHTDPDARSNEPQDGSQCDVFTCLRLRHTTSWFLVASDSPLMAWSLSPRPGANPYTSTRGRWIPPAGPLHLASHSAPRAVLYRPDKTDVSHEGFS